MGRWLDHTVITEVQAPVDRVWIVWSDFEAMPRWMRWIESVKTREDPDLTDCLLYTSPSPRDRQKSRMPSSA